MNPPWLRLLTRRFAPKSRFRKSPARFLRIDIDRQLDPQSYRLVLRDKQPKQESVLIWAVPVVPDRFCGTFF